jgi:hypothetical protein
VWHRAARLPKKILFYTFFFSFFTVRRRKGERLFLVAFYECDEDFELENLERDRLYCSKESWIGNVPKCMPVNTDEDETGDEEGEFLF